MNVLRTVRYIIIMRTFGTWNWGTNYRSRPEGIDLRSYVFHTRLAKHAGARASGSSIKRIECGRTQRLAWPRGALREVSCAWRAADARARARARRDRCSRSRQKRATAATAATAATMMAESKPLASKPYRIGKVRREPTGQSTPETAPVTTPTEQPPPMPNGVIPNGAIIDNSTASRTQSGEHGNWQPPPHREPEWDRPSHQLPSERQPPLAPPPPPPLLWADPATNGMIFLCDEKTESECMRRSLLGLPGMSRCEAMLRDVMPETRLFLFNVHFRVMLGPFRAVAEPGRNLEPGAWEGLFPLQVRIGSEARSGKVLHLPEDRLRRWVAYQQDRPRQMHQRLDDVQAHEIGMLFERFGEATVYTCSPAPRPPGESEPPPPRNGGGGRNWDASASEARPQGNLAALQGVPTGEPGPRPPPNQLPPSPAAVAAGGAAAANGVARSAVEEARSSLPPSKRPRPADEPPAASSSAATSARPGGGAPPVASAVPSTVLLPPRKALLKKGWATEAAEAEAAVETKPSKAVKQQEKKAVKREEKPTKGSSGKSGSSGGGSSSSTSSTASGGSSSSSAKPLPPAKKPKLEVSDAAAGPTKAGGAGAAAKGKAGAAAKAGSDDAVEQALSAASKALKAVEARLKSGEKEVADAVSKSGGGKGGGGKGGKDAKGGKDSKGGGGGGGDTTTTGGALRDRLAQLHGDANRLLSETIDAVRLPLTVGAYIPIPLGAYAPPYPGPMCNGRC